ncbi:MAG TPA: TolC family protein [Terriglobales bacterium]|nr:TolC family protein [Terriglobales bacterium]
MKYISFWMLTVVGLLCGGPMGVAQQRATNEETAKLADLLAEAEKNSPQIQVAKQEWQSMRQMPTQVSTLPDPQVALQQVNVGSPRPFAGFTNSDFAYIGLGVSQDFPYPGKLHLRRELASKDAGVAEQKVEVLRRAIFSELKTTYFRLAFLAKQRSILDGDRELLRQMEQAAEVKYRSGMGNQQEVLQAQLEQTKLLREVTANRLEAGKLQAELKQLLGRPQTSQDILADDISESSITRSFDGLLAALQANNPQLSVARKNVEKQKVAIEIAKKDFYPDFNAQFMWQRTDPSQYRAYYQFTVGARIPIYRKRKQQPELAQAEIEKSRTQSELEAESQELASTLRQQYVGVEQSAELLKLYREGLLPQAKAGLQAGFAAYESNRQDFVALLTSFLDVLKLDEEYWQTLAEHEAAIGQIEELTGLSLR